jgi:hypothetical protein
LLKQRKNKKFNYKPRFSKENELNTTLEDDSKVDEFVSKWQRVRKVNRKRGTRGFSIRWLIIILVLLLIGMYILDFKFR